MTVPTAAVLQRYILRIFNGPLQGAEFPLGEGSTLFVVGPAQVLGNEARCASIPVSTIYVPLEQGGCNFEVLADQATSDGTPVRLLGDSVEVRHCAFQVRGWMGGLEIALRPENQSWAPGLFTLPGSEPIHPDALESWTAPSMRWAGGGLALLVSVIATGFWGLPEPTPEADIQALIAGASTKAQVLRGRDGSVYVFVASERDAGWSRQVLTRHDTSAGQVLLIDQERRRLEQLLVDHDPQLAWHFLDLKDPSVPRLLLSAQRNVLTPDKQAGLLEVLLAAAPYASDIVVQMQDDALLADAAQGGLERLALGFERAEHEGGVTFAVAGNLQDYELAAARGFVDEFYRQWGNRHVHFTVELKDDALKGKSFQTGPQGYVKTSASSWHFSQTNRVGDE